MQSNSYLAITVCVYFYFLNTVTTTLKRLMGLYNLSKAIKNQKSAFTHS